MPAQPLARRIVAADATVREALVAVLVHASAIGVAAAAVAAVTPGGWPTPAVGALAVVVDLGAVAAVAGLLWAVELVRETPR